MSIAYAQKETMLLLVKMRLQASTKTKSRGRAPNLVFATLPKMDVKINGYEDTFRLHFSLHSLRKFGIMINLKFVNCCMMENIIENMINIIKNHFKWKANESSIITNFDVIRCLKSIKFKLYTCKSWK